MDIRSSALKINTAIEEFAACAERDPNLPGMVSNLESRPPQFLDFKREIKDLYRIPRTTWVTSSS